MRADPARFAMPTLHAYLPRVRAAADPGANRTYGSYWTTMDRLWGERRLDQISATDIEALQHHAATTARSRRNSRHARHAGEHVGATSEKWFPKQHRVPSPTTMPFHVRDRVPRRPARR
jgi:hypothetical protein